MSLFIEMGVMPLQTAVVVTPPFRGRQYSNEIGFISRSRLPTDTIGNFQLTLTNLFVGSTVLIETLAGSVIEFRNATSSDELFVLPAYAVGNSNNSLRVKVRKGSIAPFFQPYETQTTAYVGSQSIFVSQIPDE